MIPLASLPQSIEANPEWIIAGAIVLLGLFVYGFKDLIKFSLTRTWAISGVCFAESIRRRVLWIIPLAILGAIIVAQLQHPTDEQDAIRETTKFCLFATGLVVTITAIILACTNLPKEIETRVIYTIVTKPTTRLEIIVGKIIGFARVSATILLIMGIFTMGYMQVRSWSLGAAIDQRLKDGTADAATSAMLTHYREAGLLNARTYAQTSNMQILAREPKPGDRVRWIYGGEGNFIVPFQWDHDQLTPQNDATQTPGSAGAVVVAHIGFEQSDFGPPPSTVPPPPTRPSLPDTISAPQPAPATAAVNKPPNVPAAIVPTVTVSLLDQNLNTLLDAHEINGGKPIALTDPTGQSTIYASIPSGSLQTTLKSDLVYLEVNCTTAKIEYSIGPDPVVIAIPMLNDDPNAPPILDNRARVILPVPDALHPERPAPPRFRTNEGLYGEQVRGGSGKTPVAIYEFRNVHPTPDDAGNIPFELRVGIERGGGGSGESDGGTQVEATIVNHSPAGDQQFGPVNVAPEINRTAFFTMPAASVQGGNFDVDLRCITKGQFIGVHSTSLNLVVAEHSFILNLGKSLLVLWLMSVLVVIISIFCSTFLSWPIAVVLTVLILLGHWGVAELGDSTAPGIGNLVATDMGLRDPSKMRVVSDMTEALAKMLNVLTKVLPDITQFSALEDIERGVSLPLSRLTDSLIVIAGFGIPLTVVAYVFIRNKEVAP